MLEDAFVVHISQVDPLIHSPLGSAVERVTSNDKVVSSTLAVGMVCCNPLEDSNNFIFALGHIFAWCAWCYD